MGRFDVVTPADACQATTRAVHSSNLAIMASILGGGISGQCDERAKKKPLQI